MQKNRLEHVVGMRGVAILLVLFYHMLPGVCPNGFFGVDVFFVISGYFLIGRQLSGPQSYSLVQFLKSRAQRILPPFLLIILLSTICSILLFPADDILRTEVVVKASLLGRVNQYLDSRAGDYFSTDTRLFPLMHFWYMGVLLQCYLILSLIFFVWNRLHLSKKWRVATLILPSLGSLFVAVYYPFTVETDSTYYWTTARFWEFSLGGFCALFPPCKSGKLTAGGALTALVGLVIVSFIPLRNSYLYVGGSALLGCFLLVGGNSGICGHVLKNKLVMWVGTISFSLYLVHWLWICYAEFILAFPLTVTGAVCLLLPVFFTSWVYYRLVECRVYPLWSIPCLWGLCYLAHASTGRTDGYRTLLHTEANRFICAPYKYREVPYASPLYEGTENIGPNRFEGLDAHTDPLLYDLGDTSQPVSFVVLGDSHANDAAVGFDVLGKAHAWHGVQLNTYIVPFWGADYSYRYHNINAGFFFDEQKAHEVMRWLFLHPEIKTVFITQHWQARYHPYKRWNGRSVVSTVDIEAARQEEFAEFCRNVIKTGKQVVVLTDHPNLRIKDTVRAVRSRIMWGSRGEKDAPFLQRIDEYEKANAAALTMLRTVEQKGLCRVLHREPGCFPGGVYNAYPHGVLLHRDEHHLTEAGAVYSLQHLVPQIQEILRESASCEQTP